MTPFTAVVTDIKLVSRQGLAAVWWMSLDNTSFVPGSHGWLKAETRSGTKLKIEVTAIVVDADAVVWHVVEKPLAAGTDVQGAVLQAGLITENRQSRREVE